MKVSVVIPTYNREGLLGRAIQSVINQTYQDWDLWVVDDGGEDRSADITGSLARYLASGKINYLKISHNGVSAARNAGAAKSSGSVVAFLDSDDEWLPRKLETQLIFWEKQPDTALIYSAEIWMRESRRVNPPKRYNGISGMIFPSILKTCIISPSTSVIKRTIFDELGGFNESYPVCEDYDLWLRLCSRYCVGFVTEPLVIRHGGRSDQLSRIIPAMDYWRVRAMAELASNNELAVEDIDLLEHEILHRAKVLLKGYRRRGNTEKVSEVTSLVRCVLPDFSP